MPWWLILLLVVAGLLVLLALYDVTQRRHAILRNFPIIGHLRFLLEAIGPCGHATLPRLDASDAVNSS